MLHMEDVDYDALASKAGRGCAAEEDDEWLLPGVDKPGFTAWADALTSRKLAPPGAACIGTWNEEQAVVELCQLRGKKVAVLGFHARGKRCLWPEEALALLDDGLLYLQASAQLEGEASATAAVTDTTTMSDEDEHLASAPVASEKGGPARLLSFEDSYSLLAAHCDLTDYYVYSTLRSYGLVLFRHDDELEAHVPPLPVLWSPEGACGGYALAPAPATSAVTSDMSEEARELHTEPALHVSYDVYARDGLTSFRPSNPGPPDFYVIIFRSTDAPPTSRQLQHVTQRLVGHMEALRKEQAALLESRGEMALTVAAFPQIKCAIASHTTVTFYSPTPASLQPPQQRAGHAYMTPVATPPAQATPSAAVTMPS